MDERPTYKKYLQLDKVLNSQELRSKVLDSPVHDEMLFIIIHQIYGVFRDGKPLSDFPLFVDSKKAWTALAKKAGYKLILTMGSEMDICLSF